MDRQISLQIDKFIDRWGLRYVDTWIRQMEVHGYMDQIDGGTWIHGLDRLRGGTWIHGLDRWRYMDTWIRQMEVHGYMD